MAVLKGSTSATRDPIPTENAPKPSTSAAETYFPSHKYLCDDSGGFHCGKPTKRESCASNSCKAPKGQSQPQNTPRPSSTSEIAVYIPIITISGSARKETN